MNNEIDEYEQGQQDMLALIKNIYYTSSREEFEKFLGKDELDIAERVASDLGGAIRKIYVSE